MKLYLLRHATAQDIAPSDAARELTQEGREEARIAGAALAKLGARTDHIFTSPLARARQTAELAGKALGFADEIVVLSELENGHTTASLLKALKPYAAVMELLLVGHMPDLAGHLAALLGADNAGNLALGKGSVACVELVALRAGTGRLRWLMRQRQLAEIAG
jgi:phosphohistidine phosphatase